MSKSSGKINKNEKQFIKLTSNEFINLPYILSIYRLKKHTISEACHCLTVKLKKSLRYRSIFFCYKKY